MAPSVCAVPGMNGCCVLTAIRPALGVRKDVAAAHHDDPPVGADVVYGDAEAVAYDDAEEHVDPATGRCRKRPNNL